MFKPILDIRLSNKVRKKYSFTIYTAVGNCQISNKIHLATTIIIEKMTKTGSLSLLVYIGLEGSRPYTQNKLNIYRKLGLHILIHIQTF